jgi:glycosyltransferase involved in cell wall biosynthesis
MNNKNYSSCICTIIMPTLNQFNFIAQAIESIFENSLSPVELVVVDGLSSDGTLEIVSKLQIKYPNRIKLVSSNDSGPAEALNKALLHCNGNIIGWLNSDDIYAPGAIYRALDYFDKYPHHQLVYGFAQHIDSAGVYLNRYPTKPPKTRIDDFSLGNFICQPTVFMRKDALDLVGPFDESLKTAFDFDLWLRFFKRFPGQLGLIRRIQASSRLHAACLTQSQRQTVALEGMKVLKRHLNHVPLHWFHTHLDEMCATYPFGSNRTPLINQLEAFIKSSKSFLAPSDLQILANQLRADYRLILSKPGLAVTVQPDGWVSREVSVKYLWKDKPAAAVLLRCAATWPVEGKMRLKVHTPRGDVLTSSIEVPDEFVLRLEVPPTDKSGAMIWSIETAQSFVPSKYDKTSTDNRRLSFKVLELSTEA